MSIEQFLIESNIDSNYFICGGADIYNQLSPFCNRMIISFMEFECAGDILLPELNWDDYSISSYSKYLEFTTYYYDKKMEHKHIYTSI